MARPQSKGLTYLNLDISFLQDRKVRRLVRRNGEKAPLVYIALLCTIYAEGYYIKWDADTALDLADAARMEEDYIQDVIEGCLEVGLLSKEMFDKYKILTSHGIQKQYQAICDQCKRKMVVNEYSLLISSEEMPVNSEETPVSSEETPKNEQKQGVSSEEMPQRKEKKSKVKNNKETYSSSLSSSSDESCANEEFLEEQQQQFFVLDFMTRNWQEPVKEFFTKFLPWNNSGGRCWKTMDRESREAAVIQWRQNPKRKERFPDAFLGIWSEFVRDMIEHPSADAEVIWAAMDDGLSWTELEGNRCRLKCHLCLHDYIEKHLGFFQSLLQKTYGNDVKLHYSIDDVIPDSHGSPKR